MGNSRLKPCYEGSGIRLFLAPASAQWGRQVVIRSHAFNSMQPQWLQSMAQCVNSALHQARSHSLRSVLDLQIHRSGTDWYVDWVLDGLKKDVAQIIEEVKVTPARGTVSELALGAPVLVQSNFKFFRITRAGWGDTVVKAHEFSTTPEDLKLASQCLGSVLAQVRAQHWSVCRVHEVSFGYANNSLTIYTAIEGLATDLATVIQERQSVDTFAFLKQMASALHAFHAKQIAHADIQPQHVFADHRGTFKLGFFGTAITQKSAHPHALGQSPTFMSPEQRAFLTGSKRHYDPFKADVFALGLTAIALAAHQLFASPIPMEALSQTLQSLAQGISCAPAVKALLLNMTAVEEVRRPAIALVVFALQSSQPRLMYLTKESIKRFNFVSHVWHTHPLRTRIQVNAGSAWAPMEDGRLFCCGGYIEGFSEWSTCLKYAYIVDAGEVTEVHYMIRARSHHGVESVSYKSTVYVFGGFENGTLYIGKMRECEKYDMPTDQWTLLPLMRTGRHWVSSCRWTDCVFLCGANDKVTSIEAFDLTTESFHPTEVTYPNTDSCCLCVEGNLLVVLAINCLRKYERTETGQLLLKQETSILRHRKHENTQPVANCGRLYLTIQGSCLIFDLKSGRQVEEIR